MQKTIPQPVLYLIDRIRALEAAETFLTAAKDLLPHVEAADAAALAKWDKAFPEMSLEERKRQKEIAKAYYEWQVKYEAAKREHETSLFGAAVKLAKVKASQPEVPHPDFHWMLYNSHWRPITSLRERMKPYEEAGRFKALISEVERERGVLSFLQGLTVQIPWEQAERYSRWADGSLLSPWQHYASKA